MSDAHQQQQKRPRIIPGEEVNENSKKAQLWTFLLFSDFDFLKFLIQMHLWMQFKCRLQSVVVDGTNIMAAARDACQRSLARFEAREAAAKEALKREEEWIAKLKKIRGERWLPSLAREMQVSFQEV